MAPVPPGDLPLPRPDVPAHGPRAEPPDHLGHSWSFPATGTTWRLLTTAPLPLSLRSQVIRLVEGFEQTWSRFRPSSLVRRAADGHLGEGPLVLELPPGSGAVLDLYDRLFSLTRGRVDPLTGADLVRLGYDPQMTFAVHDGAAHRLGAIHGRPTWRDAVRHEGDTLELLAPVLVDVGAAGKGFLADHVASLLTTHGVEDFLVDGSGDLLVRTSRPVRVGLEQPGRPGFVVGAVELSHGAVCGSGVDRRSWGDGLHHILDAVTGLPAREVAATWVVAGSCAVADGLATALFTTAPQELAQDTQGFAYDFALLRTDGSAAVSCGFSGLPGEIFTA